MACERIVASAAHAHIKRKNKERIKHDIRRRADQDGEHAGFCKALRCDKRIHAERELYKNRADRVNIHVIHGIADRLFARAKRQKKRAVKDQQDSRKYNGDDNLQRKAVSERLFRAFIIALSHKNGSARRAAVADQRREGRDDHNQRHTDADAGQRHGALFRNMPDIHAVDNIVQHVDKLREHRRQRKAQQELSHRLLSQKILILLHVVSPYSPSFSGVFFCAARSTFFITRRLSASNCAYSSGLSP